MAEKYTSIDEVSGYGISESGAPVRWTMQPMVNSSGAVIGETQVGVPIDLDEQLKVIEYANNPWMYLPAVEGVDSAISVGGSGGGGGSDIGIIIGGFEFLVRTVGLNLTILIVLGILGTCGFFGITAVQKTSEAVQAGVAAVGQGIGEHFPTATATVEPTKTPVLGETRTKPTETISPINKKKRVKSTQTAAALSTAVPGELFCMTWNRDLPVAQAQETLAAGIGRPLTGVQKNQLKALGPGNAPCIVR